MAHEELGAVQERHAAYYLDLADRWRLRFLDEHYVQARAAMELEHDNLREAFTWVLDTETLRRDDAGQPLACRFCLALFRFWKTGGYFAEARRWLQATIDASGDEDSVVLAGCLSVSAANLRVLGNLRQAPTSATAAVTMLRRLGGHVLGSQATRTADQHKDSSLTRR